MRHLPRELFPFYALSLPYLYCYVFLLLKRTFALKFGHNDYPRKQKVLFNELLLIEKKKNESQCNVHVSLNEASLN